MSRPATLKVGNTSYWTIMTYTSAGVLVDADSTPTVVVYKSGTLTADVVTVTKRSATTGIYDCSYNPASEAEGDAFAIQETATISTIAYVNSWSFQVLAAERGTDNASTFNPTSDTVANVTTVGTCTTNSDMRGTDGANTVAPDNTGITANGVAIAALNDFDPAVDVVTVGTNNDKTGYALSSAANDAIGAAFLAYTLTKGGAGTIERAFWQSLKVQNVTDGEVSGTPTTEAFNTNLTATTGAFDHLLIVFTTGTLAGEARPIETYSSTDGRIVLQEALTAAPSAADEFIIVPSHVHPVSEIASGVWTDPAAALLTKTGVTYTATAQSGDTIQVTLS